MRCFNHSVASAVLRMGGGSWRADCFACGECLFPGVSDGPNRLSAVRTAHISWLGQSGAPSGTHRELQPALRSRLVRGSAAAWEGREGCRVAGVLDWEALQFSAAHASLEELLRPVQGEMSCCSAEG